MNGTNYWRVGADLPTASGPQQLRLQSVVAGTVVLNESIGSIERGQSLFVETSPGGFRIYVDGVLQHERLDGLHGVATQVGIQSNAGATSKYRHLVCEAF